MIRRSLLLALATAGVVGNPGVPDGADALRAVRAGPAATPQPGARPLAAQEVRAAVGGDSIRVGDVVPVAVRVTIGPGERVLWPDTIPLGETAGDLENAARVRERFDTLADGRIQVTAMYSVTPWRPGETALPELPVRVVSGDERARTLAAQLPTLAVGSVLPEDTAGLELKPVKGVIGPNWSWWPLVLLLVALVAVALALWWWWRRRRRRGAGLPVAPAVAPREAALARLQAAREAGLVERGELKEFYTRIAAAIREYLAAIEPAWSEDLTTTELLARVRAFAGAGAATDLSGVLRPADQVKFARRQVDASTAHEEWERARSWVAGFEWPPQQAPSVEEAA